MRSFKLFSNTTQKFQKLLENLESEFFALTSTFAMCELYKTLLEHIRTGCEQERAQQTNLKELKVTLSEEWLNLPRRSNNKLMKPMPRQIDTEFKAHQPST